MELTLERIVDVPPDLVWSAWTTPSLLKQWFCPKPWTTVECDIELKPGGVFRTVMRSPEGRDMPEGVGVYLEIVPNRSLTWTNALGPGFRPQDLKDGFALTVRLTLEPHGAGTKYTATAMHATAEACAKHEQMGFHQGWGAALDQLVALIKGV